MRTTLKIFVVAALLLALLLSATQAWADAANDTFIYAIESDPGNDINTITTSSRYDLTEERLLYSPLLNYYGPGDITYLLAESYDVAEDQKTLTFHLRQGVVWSDGEPFTADDVIFTFEHIIKADYANGHDGFVYDGVPVELAKEDDYTVTLRFPVVVPNAVEVSAVEHFIFPKHIYEGDETLDNNPKNATPVGTGPYKLEEYAAGQYVKLTANESYFLGKPKIGTFIFQIVTDPNAAKLALRKGEINALVLTTADATDFEGPDSNVVIHAYPEDRVGYLAFNLGSPRVQDTNLRKAVFYALNRTEINIGVYLSEDYFVNAVSFLPYSSAYFTDDVEQYAQDLEKAQALLTQVGETPTLRIAYIANNVAVETQALIIQQQLKAVGIAVELQGLESAALFDKLEKGSDEFELFLNGYIMGIDPSNYASLFVTGSAYNYSKISDAELDGFFAAGSTESDAAKRLEIYQSAQRRLAELAVQYPLVTNKRLLAVTNDVGGIDEARLIPIYTFEDVSKLYYTAK
jgi:peptide/nickel transport system substrate-binding protein